MVKYLLLSLIFISIKYHSKAQCNERYLNRIFDNVDVIRDITFGQSLKSTGELYDLKMDIYLPQGDAATNRPLLIFLHGGTFISGDKSDFEGYGPPEDMAKRGYVGVSINYRLEPSILSVSSAELMIRAVMRAVHDTKAAIRFFYKDAKENGNTYGIDTNLVFVGGSSAGSVTALHLTYLDDTTELNANYMNYLRGFDGGDIEGISGNPGYGSRVRGVLDVSGAIGSTTYMDNNADIAVYSIHNIIDLTLPYDKGYPLFIPSLPIVHGSKPIQNKAHAIGALHYFETIYEEGHVPFKEGNSPVQPIFDNMMREASKLFYRQMGCNPDAVISGVTVNKNSGWRLFQNLAEAGTPVRLEKSRNFNSGIETITLSDPAGRIILSASITSPAYMLETAGLCKGLYFVQIRNNLGEIQLSDKIVLP
jgi:para-nitrobenzyl esterase